MLILGKTELPVVGSSHPFLVVADPVRLGDEDDKAMRLSSAVS
jgi:hypothetical protein